MQDLKQIMPASDIIYQALGGENNPDAMELLAKICWQLANNDWVIVRGYEIEQERRKYRALLNGLGE